MNFNAFPCDKLILKSEKTGSLFPKVVRSNLYSFFLVVTK
uniref:Uncharacterized protein n=1 Tax=Rhizophora mucronata TaxID=61149 RepID=A0A2P2PIA7_RHIMU